MNTYELQAFFTGLIEGIEIFFFCLTPIALATYTLAMHARRNAPEIAPKPTPIGITAATLAPIFDEPDEPRSIEPTPDETPTAAADPVTLPKDSRPAPKDLSTLTAIELKKLARSQKIPRYGSLPKARLIELLTA